MPIGGHKHQDDNQKGIPKKQQNSNRQDAANRNQAEKDHQNRPRRNQGNKGTR